MSWDALNGLKHCHLLLWGGQRLFFDGITIKLSPHIGLHRLKEVNLQEKKIRMLLSVFPKSFRLDVWLLSLVKQIIIFPSMTCSLVHISMLVLLTLHWLSVLISIIILLKMLVTCFLIQNIVKVVQLPSHLYCTGPDHSCWCFAQKLYESWVSSLHLKTTKQPDTLNYFSWNWNLTSPFFVHSPPWHKKENFSTLVTITLCTVHYLKHFLHFCHKCIHIINPVYIYVNKQWDL